MQGFVVGCRKAWQVRLLAAVAGLAPLWVAGVADAAPIDGKIAYLTTDFHWSVYQTPDGKAECPNGLNDYGPREVFAELFPNGGTEVETHLAREALKYFPEDTQDRFPYVEAVGPIAIGLNLDGKVGPRDFTSPSGEPGIDNELYRAIGCSRQYRGPEGQLQLFANRGIRTDLNNRSMIELSDVDSLENDDQVQVTIYRGLDRHLTDASGQNIMPGGTQRVDWRFGKKYIQHLKGKIVDGVLHTEPVDQLVVPWGIFPGTFGEFKFRGAQLRLNVTEDKAVGLIGGYADIETYHRTLNNWSTHHLAYGQLDPSGFNRKMRQLADGYPDENGNMTAISSSLKIDMVQVYLDYSDPARPAVEASKRSDKGRVLASQ